MFDISNTSLRKNRDANVLKTNTVFLFRVTFTTFKQKSVNLCNRFQRKAVDTDDSSKHTIEMSIFQLNFTVTHFSLNAPILLRLPSKIITYLWQMLENEIVCSL